MKIVNTDEQHYFLCFLGLSNNKIDDIGIKHHSRTGHEPFASKISMHVLQKLS